MRTWSRIVTLCASLLVVSSLAWGQTWERYLDRYRGPYRGQVIDADTKAPLVGAIVVAMWTRDRVYPFHSVNERYAVRETVTGPDGSFVLDAKDIEEGAPRRTLKPDFTIFLPGYGSFPRYQKAPTGFLGDLFEREGTTVHLPRLETRSDRVDTLRSVDPYSMTDNPFNEIPRHTELFNRERSALGLEPYPASRRPQ
jgi:hypothetical protein